MLPPEAMLTSEGYTELLTPLASCSSLESSPVPCLGRTVELALVAEMQGNWSRGREYGEADPASCLGSV